MKYKAYLKQDGGCDYTIGCGREVIDIDADSIKDAKEKLATIVFEDYNHSETKLDEIELFEVNETWIIDVNEIYTKIKQQKELNRIRTQEEFDRAELMRLKRKFGEL